MVISIRNIVLLTIGLDWIPKVWNKPPWQTITAEHALSVTGSEIPYTILYLLVIQVVIDTHHSKNTLECGDRGGSRHLGGICVLQIQS